MVAEVVHGAPPRFSDPARFSFAHGGKDRHPFPVPIKVYDETIAVLKSAVQKAKLGREDELTALARLDDQSRVLERTANGPSVEALIGQEFERSHSYGGRSVFGWEPAPAPVALSRSSQAKQNRKGNKDETFSRCSAGLGVGQSSGLFSILCSAPSSTAGLLEWQ
jgi:hypothetical protein